MDWVKRNLLFVIGSSVALVLLGLAGWYLYSKWDQNNQMVTSLNDTYEKLKRLNAQNPHPGDDKVDNIKAAKDQQKQLLDLAQKGREYFRRIPPIPDLPKIGDHEFSVALSQNISQMQRAATNASVGLQSGYGFSFTAQLNKITFSPGSPPLLATQLGEIRTICDVLIAAKVNSLDNLRRERVSADDANGPLTDYLTEKSITNELAIITPYELTFQCFSAELASVLAGFAASPNGIIVKSINVEPAPAQQATTTTPITPVYVPQPTLPGRSEYGGMDEAMRRRYGIGGAGADRYGGGAGNTYRPIQNTQPVPPPPPQPGVVAQPATGTRGGLPTVLDEKQLKVTMTLAVIKLQSGQPAK